MRDPTVTPRRKQPPRRAAWALALALHGATLRAQPVDDAAFERTFESGLRALDARRFADAVTAFSEARRVHDLPRVEYNLALAARGAGRYGVAIAAFEAYLASPDPTDTPERLARVREAVAEMRASLARVRFAVTPPTATLTLDGAALAHPDEPRVVDPGEHTLTARCDGHAPAERAFTLRAGADEVVAVALDPLAPDARVIITPSVSTASVTLDGVAIGRGSVERHVEPGEHVVVLTAPEHLALRRVFTVGRTGVVRVDATLSRRPTRWWIPAAIVGGAALVTGAVALTAWLTRGEEAYVSPSWGNFTER